MIEIFRARNASELKIPVDSEPVLVAASLDELRSVLGASALGRGEREAVVRAAAQLEGTRDAKILVAANGSIFRVEKLLRVTIPRDARPAAMGWAAAERGAPVVIAHPDAAWSRRAADALRFVGYAARPAEKTAFDTVMTAPPLVLLVAAELLDERLIGAASDRCALVALVRGRDAPPPGAHGVLSLPLDTASTAVVLDTLIRRARSGRLRLGKATPRP